jgi:hypothetical protein
MNVFLILGLFSETSGGEMIKLKTFIKKQKYWLTEEPLGIRKNAIKFKTWKEAIGRNLIF